MYAYPQCPFMSGLAADIRILIVVADHCRYGCVMDVKEDKVKPL